HPLVPLRPLRPPPEGAVHGRCPARRGGRTRRVGPLDGPRPACERRGQPGPARGPGHRVSTPARELGKREARRALHQEVSRAQILDAAEEVFASKGYHEATIREIAQLAEFSVGAVYSFFETKDDLFVQIYLRRGVEFMDGMRELMGEKQPPREQMHRLAD